MMYLKIQEWKKIFWKNKWKKNKLKNFDFLIFWYFFSIQHSVKSPASGKENVRFTDSPDFENSSNFRTGRALL